GVEITGAIDLAAPAVLADGNEAVVLLRYTNGKPAIAAKQYGNGEVLFITTTANSTWSDFGKFGHAFLPFLTETLKHLLQGPLAQHNRRAGEMLVWYPPVVDQTAEHQLLTPKNEEVRLESPRIAGQRAVVSTQPIEHAGVYRIAPLRSGGDTVTKLEPDKKSEP